MINVESKAHTQHPHTPSQNSQFLALIRAQGRALPLSFLIYIPSNRSPPSNRLLNNHKPFSSAMGKKRKSIATSLDEVDRSMYTSFCSAANSLSQLYTQAMNHQKLSFQAGERHALVRLFVADFLIQSDCSSGSKSGFTLFFFFFFNFFFVLKLGVSHNFISISRYAWFG